MNSAVADILVQHGVDPTQVKKSEFGPNVEDVIVPGRRALEIWQAVRAAFPQTGIWPIFRGDADESIDKFVGDPSDILISVPTGAPEELLRSRLEERLEVCGEMLGKPLPDNIDAVTLAHQVDASGILGFSQPEPPDTDGPQPGLPLQKPLVLQSILNHQSQKPHARVRLSLISLQHPYEAPAYLSFGGWNDVPMPEVHVALMREWYQAYGAVPASITADVLECIVDRPPQTESQAYMLAVEQWLYCDDIVSQGTQSVRGLANEICQSPTWFFWWD